MADTSIDRGSPASSNKLAILLPITSRRPDSPDSADHHDVSTVLGGVRTLAASLKTPEPAGTAILDSASCGRKPSSPLVVLVGVDHDDTVLLQHEQQLLDVFSSAGIPARFMQFDAAVKAHYGPGAVCKLWGTMANAALQEGCNCAVLLGECRWGLGQMSLSHQGC